MKSVFQLRTFFSAGDALRILFGSWCNLTSTTDDVDEDSTPLGPHGVSATTVGVSALAHDLFNFENTSKVPEGLSKYVESSRKAQVDWYRKLLKAWKQAKPYPKTAEEAASLVIQVLAKDQKADVEGLLTFYGLSLPDTIVEISIDVGKPLPKGVKFEMETLPVDARSVPDGDGVTVYVSTADPKESSCVPREVQIAAEQLSQARIQKNYERADALQQEIIDAGYRVMYVKDNKEEVLARKHRIRLRGIDAPEIAMPYGREAKEALVKIVSGKSLRVQVYGQDQYRRYVADVYCNGKLVQELMLKKGLAWHYTTYDQRQEFAKWEKQARIKRKGLWALSNPEKPWEWRKKQRERQYSSSTSQHLPGLVIFNAQSEPEPALQVNIEPQPGTE